MLLVYTILYSISALFYYLKHNYIASILMVLLAIFLFIEEIKLNKRIINIRGLFALGFIGGFGISLLKLSKLSEEYSIITFIAVFLSYFSLYIGAYFSDKKINIENAIVKNKITYTKSKFTNGQKLIVVLIVITFLSFTIEAIKLGFVPLFTVNIPHAYSTFHVFMIHYITTFYSFIPCFAILNYFYDNKDKKNLILIILSYVYVVIMSLLLISRSRLIMSIVLSIFIAIIYASVKNIKKIFTKKNIIISFAMLVMFLALYIIITINRAHNVEYLNGIFEMKNENIPIFISQPYMYIAHNFENLNYMITHIFRWTLGRRMLYPLFTLTLVKKYFPIVVDAPYFIIKTELSTVTLIYDFYYDFGLAGIVIFCFLIGYIGKYIENKTYKVVITNELNNNYFVIIFALFCYFMLFSFFQAYFSLTDTWVYIIIIYMLSLFFVTEKYK